MHFIFILIAIASLATGLTFNKSNGITQISSDQLQVINFTDILLAAKVLEINPEISIDESEGTNANGEPLYMIELFSEAYQKGFTGRTQSCDWLFSVCRPTDDWFPRGISSIKFNGCRHGQLNYGVSYGCIFFETNNCELSKEHQAIWLTYGFDSLAIIGWDKRIHSLMCYRH